MTQFNQDMIRIAVGHIGYWARVNHYDPAEFSANITEIVTGTEYMISPKTVNKAMKVLSMGPQDWIDEETRSYILANSYLSEKYRDPNAWMADIVVQVGLFGKIVYDPAPAWEPA